MRLAAALPLLQQGSAEPSFFLKKEAETSDADPPDTKILSQMFNFESNGMNLIVLRKNSL